MKMLSERQARWRLVAAVAAAGGPSVAGRRWRINRVYLSEMCNGRERINERMLRRIGLQRVVGYIALGVKSSALFRK